MNWARIVIWERNRFLTASACKGGISILILALLSSAFAAPVREEEDTGEVISLPPVVVSEKLQWLRGDIPGYEVLSLCSLDATEAYLRATYRLNHVFTAVAPTNFQVRSSAPAILILLDAEIAGQLSNEMSDEMRRRVDTAERDTVTQRPQFHLNFASLPNLQLWERDSAVICSVLRDLDWNRTIPAISLSLPLERERFLLGNRRPALPVWYVEAAIDLFNSAKLSNRGITLPLFALTDPQQMVLLSALPGHAGIRDQPTNEDGFPTGLFLIPMEKFLTEGIPPSGTTPGEEAYRQAWFRQADFFMRCALDEEWNRTTERPFPPGAFWRFVDRVSAGSVSEALCRECFGCDYHGLEQRLIRYMDRASHFSLWLLATSSEPEPEIALHYATKLEIARLKGEWDRRMAKYVQRKFPATFSLYKEDAERTLTASYKRGERDSSILSSLGLLKLESNDPKGAREFLEEATAKGVVRPRPYIELAYLYYREALDQSKNHGGKLTLEQANRASAPLLAAKRLEPVLPESGELLAEIWTHAEAAPPRPIVLAIDENARKSGRPRLLLAAAKFDAAEKMNDKARDLIALALQCQPDETTRAQALQLRDSVKP